MSLRATSSFIPLIILTMISSAAHAVLALYHLNIAKDSEVLRSLAWQLLVALWVYLDRRSSHVSLPFEFNAFVFFAWPLALPYYLYKSRGARGFLIAALIFALLIVPDLVTILGRMYTS